MIPMQTCPTPPSVGKPRASGDDPVAVVAGAATAG